MRVRSGQAVRGVAQPRGYEIDRNPPQLFSPWGLYSPWYGYGYGYSYGPSSYFGLGYDPWLYGGSMWSWNRYGWHDPFLFDPFGYAGYAPYYWPSSGGGRSDVRADGVASGSLRLRVNPGEARVYIDGALAGVASEFGGLTNHLDLPAGRHEIELRADGYVNYTGQVEVREGRTQTERVNLKRQ